MARKTKTKTAIKRKPVEYVSWLRWAERFLAGQPQLRARYDPVEIATEMAKTIPQTAMVDALAKLVSLDRRYLHPTGTQKMRTRSKGEIEHEARRVFSKVAYEHFRKNGGASMVMGDGRPIREWTVAEVRAEGGMFQFLIEISAGVDGSCLMADVLDDYENRRRPAHTAEVRIRV